MNSVMISSSGLHRPSNVLTNTELVNAFNQYVADFNDRNREAIAAGLVAGLSESSADFIVSASGIENRYVVDKSGLVDANRLRPRIEERTNDEVSLQCEMAYAASRQALEAGDTSPEDLDGIIVACSNFQRPYPAIAIELQNALGAKGFAFDMNVACSSATFAIGIAHDLICTGSAKKILIANPEICSAHLDFKDRDCHFIFGDAATALVLERFNPESMKPGWQVISHRLNTQFSNNIRNNFGFLSPCHEETMLANDKLFKQNGRKVFKEVVPLVVKQLQDHLRDENLSPRDIARFWLHQANLTMNHLVCKKILEVDQVDGNIAPSVLSEFANTSSAGSIIAFHLHSTDLPPGSQGVICSFGAGYSVGSILVRKVG